MDSSSNYPLPIYSKRNEQDALSNVERIKNALELTRGEKNTLERQKMSLTDTIDSITLENQKLQAANRLCTLFILFIKKQ